MKYELDLINYTFEEELQRQGIWFKQPSGSARHYTDEVAFGFVIEYTKQVFDYAKIPYLDDIIVFVKDPNLKPINYVLKFNCEDKEWIIENAFSGKHFQFSILGGLTNTLNQVLSYYGNYHIKYCQICYYIKDENRIRDCISYYVLLSAEEQEWFSKSLRNYNFAKKLHESNEKTFKNICIRMNEVRFETKLNYRLLTERFSLNQAKQFIEDRQSFIFDNYVDIGKKIFAASKFENLNELFSGVLEIFSLLDLKTPLVRTEENDNTFIIAIADEKITIEKGYNIQSLFKEVNFILQKFNKEERIFHLEHTSQNYFFIAKKVEGFAIIDAYNAIGEIKIDNYEMSIKRQVSYMEKHQLDRIGKVDFIFPPTLILIKIEEQHLELIQNNYTEELGIVLNVTLAECVFADFRFKPYYKNKLTHDDDKEWIPYFVINGRTQTFIGTCGVNMRFLPEGILELSYDCTVDYPFFTDWDVRLELINSCKFLINNNIDFQNIIIHSNTLMKKYFDEHGNEEWTIH